MKYDQPFVAVERDGCFGGQTIYLRPGLKHSPFSPAEEAIIIQHHSMFGNKWALIASQLPGRTDNEIKNFWSTHLKKRISSSGPNLQTNHSCSSSKSINIKCESSSTSHTVLWESARIEAEGLLSMDSYLVNRRQKGRVDCFLQLWNSEVGDAFRKIKEKDGGASKKFTSQPSSSIKIEPGWIDEAIQATPTYTTRELEDSCKPKPGRVPAMLITTSTSSTTSHEQEVCYKPNVDVMAVSDSISSNEFSGSSDTALKLLSDLQGAYDMEFIQKVAENFCNFLD